MASVAPTVPHENVVHTNGVPIFVNSSAAHHISYSMFVRDYSMAPSDEVGAYLKVLFKISWVSLPCNDRLQERRTRPTNRRLDMA
jgi:hypothetical protein